MGMNGIPTETCRMGPFFALSEKIKLCKLFECSGSLCYNAYCYLIISVPLLGRVSVSWLKTINMACP